MIPEDQKHFLGVKKTSSLRFPTQVKTQRIKTIGDPKKLLHFVACTALSQGQVQALWRAQYFRKVFAESPALSQGTVQISAPSHGQVQISWQAQHFRKVRYRFHGRHSTFARCGTDFAAGAALSQGQVQIPWQAQCFRKVRYRARSRCSTFARSGTDFAEGAAHHAGNPPLIFRKFSEINAPFVESSLLRTSCWGLPPPQPPAEF